MYVCIPFLKNVIQVCLYTNIIHIQKKVVRMLNVFIIKNVIVTCNLNKAVKT